MSDALQQVLHYLQEHREEHLEALFRLLRQPSISARVEGLADCAHLLSEMLQASGLATQVIPTAGAPVVYAERVRPDRPFTVLFYGHYDVQPPEPLAAWHSPPFQPTVRDGRIYARGAGDNKGQHIAHILAIQAFLATVGELPVSVKLVIDGEEESGSPNLDPFVAAHRDLLRADLVYTADGPYHDSGRPAVIFGVRGMLYVELSARGPNTNVHSGGRGNLVPNPAWKLVDLLATMRSPDGRVIIDGFYDAVRQPTPAELDLAAGVPFDPAQFSQSLGLPSTPIRDAVDYCRRLMFEPTFNIAGFTSGYGGPGMQTIIPSEALLKMDLRLVADQDPDDIFAKFQAHVAKHAPDVTVRKLGTFLPSRTSPELPVSRLIVDTVRQARGMEPVVMPSLGASLPDSVWTQGLGVPSVLVPYANPDQGNHGPNENIRLEDFYAGIRTSAHVLDALGRLGSNR